MAFKRKRVYAPRRFFGKRRRMIRRRRRVARKYGTTSQYGRSRVLSSMFRKKRRFTGRRFQRAMFTESRFKTHYRSIFAQSTLQTTHAGLGSSETASAIRLSFPLNNNGGVPFWTTAGGLQAVDQGVTPPLFKDDIILRGGSIWYSFFNSQQETYTSGSIHGAALRIKFWYGYASPSNSLVSSFGTAADFNNSYDPTCTPEFAQKYGKIYHYEEAVIEAGQNWYWERKLRPSKIGQNEFIRADRAPFVLFQVTQLTDTDGLNNFSYSLKNGYNVAFSGDAIGAS